MNAIRYRWDGTRYRFIVEVIAEQPDGAAAMHLISKHETADDAAAAALKLRARRKQEEGESVTDAISLELHRAVVAQHGSAFDVLREAHVILDGIIGPDGRKIAARLQDVAADRATNAALAERVQALKAALSAAQDDAARLRKVIGQVEWTWNGYGVLWCAWCRGRAETGHWADCQRQAALAQTAQTSEVKA